MNETMKRYIVSSVVTFLTGFVFVMYSQVDSITIESFKDGSLFGVVFVATRFGIKGVMEVFLIKRDLIK